MAELTPPAQICRAAGAPRDSDALTIAELAALRLRELGTRPTAEQLLGLILRMEDQVQADVGQLVLTERITRLPAKPIPLTYLWEIGINDHYRVHPFYMGESRFEFHEHSAGPTPVSDAIAIKFPPDLVEWVVTRQAARDLFVIDPENWSEAALRWCNTDKHLSLQEELDKLGVPMTAEEVEALKIESCKKGALMPELETWLRSAGYAERKAVDIMDKKTKEDYPWVRLANAGKSGQYYRPLLKRLFEVMLPPVKRSPPGVHQITDGRRQSLVPPFFPRIFPRGETWREHFAKIEALNKREPPVTVNLRSPAHALRYPVQYLTFAPVRYSTAEFSKIAGKSAELIRKSCQVNGHYLGVGPVKEANGRLSFDALAVLEACGKIPKSTAPTPIDDFRDNLCAQTGADPFPAHKLAAHLLRESPTGDPARARFDSFASDLRDLHTQTVAFGKRLGALMNDEEDGTPDDWRLFNYYADKIENAAGVIVTRLRWRSA